MRYQLLPPSPRLYNERAEDLPATAIDLASSLYRRWKTQPFPATACYQRALDRDALLAAGWLVKIEDGVSD